ncbi:hypothetical protein SDC9_187560 [bioreactor metagenome]|uniref:Uncharacterized protein n=1 Tax=bioreactor metagenome TaxID=1076179 RepID=A0A645HLV4_9ZZZZ
MIRLRISVPLPQERDVVVRDVRAVLGAQQVLEQHLQAVWQPLLSRNLVEPVVGVCRAVDFKRVLGAEAVNTHAAPHLQFILMSRYHSRGISDKSSHREGGLRPEQPTSTPRTRQARTNLMSGPGLSLSAPMPRPTAATPIDTLNAPAQVRLSAGRG